MVGTGEMVEVRVPPTAAWAWRNPSLRRSDNVISQPRNFRGSVSIMAWRSRPASVRPGDPRDRWQTLAVVGVLFLGCLALLLTAPTGGDFWWNDAPRHALN